MRLVANSKKRIAVVCAIFLAVFSSGIVIAHQCHSISSNQVSTQHIYSDHGSAPTSSTKSLNDNLKTERLIDTGCAALFLVLLLLGRKYLDLSAPRSRLSNFIDLSRDWVKVYRPQVFQRSLSRPQLGVIRI